MAKKTEHKKRGGLRKIGRRKRAVNQPMSLYSKGEISFESYYKATKK